MNVVFNPDNLDIILWNKFSRISEVITLKDHSYLSSAPLNGVDGR